jgi:hypothetical protein
LTLEAVAYAAANSYKRAMIVKGNKIFGAVLPFIHIES